MNEYHIVYDSSTKNLYVYVNTINPRIFCWEYNIFTKENPYKNTSRLLLRSYTV